MRLAAVTAFLSLLVAFALLLVPTPLAGQGTDRQVVVIEIEGEIRGGTDLFVERTLRAAAEREADLFVILLDTPGGLLKPTQEISQLLLESDLKTAVFVSRAGGWAFSAGTFLLLSADVAAVHPEASLGAAQPRLLTPEGIGEPDEKLIAAAASWMRNIAEARGRNADVAERFVRDNLTLSGEEANREGVVDLTPRNLPELFAALDLPNADVVTFSLNVVERLLLFLSIPQIVSLLLTIGFLGIVLVFRTGEVVELGLIAALAFLLGLWGIGAIAISTLGITLLLLGVALLAVELASPELGVFGVLGTIALVGGMIFLAQEPFGTPVLTQGITYAVVGAGASAALFFLLSGRMALAAARKQPATGAEMVIGKEGVVTEALNPYGTIAIDGQAWRAKASRRKVARGRTVVVVAFFGNTCYVRERKVR